MTRESFRREINREFDAMSGSPSPALPARVRAALAETRPARIGPPVWMAGVAAAMIALIIVGVLVASNLNRHQTGIVPGGAPSPSPSPVASGTPNATPSAQASPTSPAGAYDCNSSGIGASVTSACRRRRRRRPRRAVLHQKTSGSEFRPDGRRDSAWRTIR